MEFIERSTFEVVEEVFGASQGLFIGEDHNSEAIEAFMVSNMERLSGLGVQQLYMEMGLVEDMAAYEAFNNAEPGTPEWDETLQALIEARSDNVSIHAADNRLEMMIAARNAGIEVYPIDYDRGDDDRITVNSTWAQTVLDKKQSLETGERYIVFGGIYHSSAEFNNSGVDRILDIPSIDQINPNLNEFRYKFSFLNSSLLVEGDGIQDSDYALVFTQSPEEYFAFDINHWTNEGRLDLVESYDILIADMRASITMYQNAEMGDFLSSLPQIKERMQALLNSMPSDTEAHQYMQSAFDVFKRETEGLELNSVPALDLQHQQ
ncbi:MAG: hypothetical protein AB8B83_07585 [Bdellovibrionales bacterium]